MTYDETAVEVVSAKRARAEVEAHGLAWSDFIAEVGERGSYVARVVLDWLGY